MPEHQTNEHAESAAQPAGVHAHSEVAGHGSEHESGAFPPFDSSTFGSQLLWLAITFGLLYYLMSKVALPRIANILEVRRDRIASDLSEAEHLKQETDEAIAYYEQALSEARQKARGIANTAREEAKSHIDAEFANVESDITTRLSQAEEQIAKVKEKAMVEIDTIAESTAGAILKQILDKDINKGDVAAAVVASKLN